MFKSLITFSLKSLVKARKEFITNLLGVVLCLVAGFFLSAFLYDEATYDGFHTNAGDIYQVRSAFTFGDEVYDWDLTVGPLSQKLVEEIPQIELSARVREEGDNIFALKAGADVKSIGDIKTLLVDSSFLEIFDFKLVAGNRAGILAKPRSVVLTERIANVFFEEGQALGQSLEYNNRLYQVTGVLEDPAHTHLEFDVLVSMSSNRSYMRDKRWTNFLFQTYFLKSSEVAEPEIKNQVERLEERHFWEPVAKSRGFDPEYLKTNRDNTGFYITRVKDIHLDEGANRQAFLVVSIILVLVMLIGFFNYINLVTARSMKKAKELGLRRVLGATDFQVVSQFLIESVLQGLVAFVLAWIIIGLSAPYFETLFSKDFATYLGFDYLLMLLLFSVLVFGILGGLFSGLYLMRVDTMMFLRGNLEIVKNRFGASIRSILIIFQFAISAAFVMLSLAIISQINFIGQKGLGYDTENILVLKSANHLGKSGEAFKQELLRESNIVSAAFSMNIPNTNLSGSWSISANDGEEVLFDWRTVDHDYVPTYGFEILQGRNFSKEFPSDSLAVIINKTGAQKLALGEDPVGQMVRVNGVNARVIGITGDYHFESLHSEIRPTALFLPNWDSWLEFVSVRLKNDDLNNTISHIDRVWQQFLPEIPVEHVFFDEYTNRLYLKERTLSRVSTFFTTLAAVLASIGLIGFVSFGIEQRLKEIGVRKSVGASVGDILKIVLLRFLKPVAIGFVIALVPSYLFIQSWLSEFSYRIDFGVISVAIALSLVMVVAFSTIITQCLSASRIGPVKLIRR